MCYLFLLNSETFLLNGGRKSFTMMAFTWQDSFDMVASVESVKTIIYDTSCTL